MPFAIVPNAVSTSDAEVWVGALNEPFDPASLALTSNVGLLPLDAAWDGWTRHDGQASLTCQRVRLHDLHQRTRYDLRLLLRGVEVATASLVTLPRELPTRDQQPFIALLGSCFCAAKDREGRVGRTYLHLPAGARPDVKFLCGDQVYLDAPWEHFLTHRHSQAQLEARFFDTYYDAWLQRGDDLGFQHVLAHGANYFCSDDHEFWNNAPNRGAYVVDTWTSAGRDAWLASARRFYQLLQTPRTWTSFDVSPLSFFIADTRIHRDPDRQQFMAAPDFAALGAWIQGLDGPGVLVVGQPVFAGKAGWMGHFADWSLPDFEQYRQLARWLGQARHSILILTGDVHYGRSAACTLASGVTLFEVIASPLALVDDHAKGRWAKAPAYFPVFEIPGVIAAETSTGGFATNDNHFQTLEFTAVGRSVRVNIRAWRTTSGIGTAPSEPVAVLTLR